MGCRSTLSFCRSLIGDENPLLPGFDFLVPIPNQCCQLSICETMAVSEMNFGLYLVSSAGHESHQSASIAAMLSQLVQCNEEMIGRKGERRGSPLQIFQVVVNAAISRCIAAVQPRLLQEEKFFRLHKFPCLSRIKRPRRKSIEVHTAWHACSIPSLVVLSGRKFF